MRTRSFQDKIKSILHHFLRYSVSKKVYQTRERTFNIQWFQDFYLELVAILVGTFLLLFHVIAALLISVMKIFGLSINYLSVT